MWVSTKCLHLRTWGVCHEGETLSIAILRHDGTSDKLKNILIQEFLFSPPPFLTKMWMWVKFETNHLV